MPIYKVKWDATGAGNGSSWADAYTTPALAIAAHSATGDIIEISGGPDGHTYVGTVDFRYGGTAILRGSSDVGHNGLVTLDAAGAAESTLLTSLGKTVENLSIAGAGSGQYNLYCTGNTTCNNVNLSGGARSFCLESGTTAMNNCIISMATDVNRTATVYAAATLTTNSCIYARNRGGMSIYGSWTDNGSLILGNGGSTSSGYALVDACSATSSITFNNSSITSNYKKDGSDLIVKHASASVIYNNCNILPTPFGTGDCLGTRNNCLSVSPKFVKLRDAYASFVVDDYYNIDTFIAVMAAADTLDVKIGYALSHFTSVTPEHWTILRNAVANGHEIINHSINHPTLTIDEGFTLIGPASSSYTLSTDTTNPDPTNWTGIFVCLVSDSPVLTIDVSFGEPYASCSMLRNWINAQLGVSGWTATISNTTAQGVPVCCLEPTIVPVVVTSDTEIKFNYTKYLYYEVGYSKQLIESNIGGGYECKMFAYPGGTYNAAIKGLINSAAIYPPGVNKHIGARSIATSDTFLTAASSSLGSDYTSGSDLLAGLQVFEIAGTLPADISGNSPTDAKIASDWTALAEWLKFTGSVWVGYQHGPGMDGASFYDAATTYKCMAALISAGIPIVTPTAMIELVRDSGMYSDVDADGSRWSRVFDSHDYHLQSSSLLKGAGISIPAIHEQATPATDLDGNIIHFLPPSIGPYDGQGDTKTITTTPYAPTGYSVRGTEASPAKIKLGADDLDIDVSGLTSDEEIIASAGTKRVTSFTGQSTKQYLTFSKTSGSSNGIFGPIFG